MIAKILKTSVITVIALALIFSFPITPTSTANAVSIPSSDYASSYVSGEILVKFNKGFSPTDLFLSKYGLSSPEQVIKPELHKRISNDIKSIGLDRWYKVKLSNSFADPLAVARMVISDLRVEAAEPNYIFKTQSGSDPFFEQQWGLYNEQSYNGIVPGISGVRPQQQYKAHIDAQGAWDEGFAGDPFNVAVIDTGIDYNHEDLRNRMWPGRGCNFITGDAGNCGDPMDDNGHGTHVAGVIGAEHDNGAGIRGVTDGARLASLKACNDSGLCNADNVAEAINYAINNDFKVINASFGAHINQALLGGGHEPSLFVFEAISTANDNEVLFITSAGNLLGPTGPSGGPINIDAFHYYPASYPLQNVIVVTNTDLADNRIGNWGTVSVDLGAPGVSILSTFPSNKYIQRSGSSISAAFVSGAVALYWSTDDNLNTINYLEIKDRLLHRTDKVTSLTGTTVSGGRLNVCRIFEAGSCGNPTPDIPNL